MMFPDEPFYENYIGEYYYDEKTNEVLITNEDNVHRLEASVLIELLAELIKEISKIQSLSTTVNKEEP